MKKVLFVTVGTTALFATRLPQCAPRDENLAKDLTEYDNIRNPDKDVEGVERTAYSERKNLVGRLVDAHSSFWAGLNRAAPDRRDYYSTSAELISTLGLLGSPKAGFKDFFHEPAGNIVLLASNTAEGILAARVNLRVLHTRVLAKPCEGIALKDGCEHIAIEIVPGMETNSGFTTLHEGILKAVSKYRGSTAAFNITGGFKGVIPYLTWLSINGDMFPGAPLWYQHERMTTATEIVFRPTAGDGKQNRERHIMPEERTGELVYLRLL